MHFNSAHDAGMLSICSSASKGERIDHGGELPMYPRGPVISRREGDAAKDVAAAHHHAHLHARFPISAISEARPLDPIRIDPTKPVRPSPRR